MNYYIVTVEIVRASGKSDSIIAHVAAADRTAAYKKAVEPAADARRAGEIRTWRVASIRKDG